MEVAISNSKAKFILGIKKKILKPFQYVLDENNGEPQHGCVIVPMMGERGKAGHDARQLIRKQILNR